MKNLIVVLVIMVTALAGCVSVDGRVDRDTARIAATLGVQIAVIEYVGDSPKRAAAVSTGIAALRTFLNDRPDTLFEVEDEVTRLVDQYALNAGLEPSSVLLLRSAARVVLEDIRLIVPGGMLTDETRGRILYYLNKVDEAVTLATQ